MQRHQIDSVTKLFGERRLSRRIALQTGGATAMAGALAVAGLSSSGAAQDATPEPAVPFGTPEAGSTTRTPYLFVQSFEGGTIMPKDGEEGRFTVTLQHGLGQTLFFSDRPERVVGATPTPDFLTGLGFTDDNPPNAAMVIDDGQGGTNLAVVELFNPLFDPTSPGVTYDLAVLQDYQDSTDLGFTDAPADLSAIPSAFGSAHLFIDDCADTYLYCKHLQPGGGYDPAEAGQNLGSRGQCWGLFTGCRPCEEEQFYQAQCVAQFPDYCNQQTPCGVPLP